MKAELAQKLSRLEGFEDPKIQLEQYVTPPQLAADMVHAAYMQGDIEGKRVVDLGTGTGILAVGAALAGAEKVVAVEKDSEALEVALENARDAGVESVIEFVEKDVEDFEGSFDTCVMNPPFSVHSELLEDFYRAAFSVADAVYALGPRDDSIKEFAREHGHEVLGAEDYSIGLESSYGFHTEEVRETGIRLIVTRRKQ
ncbi:MAG: METTL5 family protein [Candidatus Nanohaloarchaea archaeon]